jgi:hypothetical protein
MRADARACFKLMTEQVVTCTSGAWKLHVLHACRPYVYVLGYDTEHYCI